jgi:FkbM family methyltransferase
MGAVIGSRGRVGRKLHDVRIWMDTGLGPVDRIAAAWLALCRTRPLLARMARALTGRVWLRPKLLRGRSIFIDPCSAAQFTVYQEIFIDGVYDLGRLSFEPDVVIDCGAFEGYFSLLARAHFHAAQILAFEPNADNAEGLRLNTRLPALNISAHAAAVSTADGEGSFSGGGCGGRLDATATESVRVPVRSLLSVLAETRAQRLLLKLDIEGEEAKVLPAVLPALPRRSAIFFEWHQGADSYAEMKALLEANGFHFSPARQHQLDGVVYIDAFAQRT